MSRRLNCFKIGRVNHDPNFYHGFFTLDVYISLETFLEKQHSARSRKFAHKSTKVLQVAGVPHQKLLAI
jgi:hypothetical protein